MAEYLSALHLVDQSFTYTDKWSLHFRLRSGADGQGYRLDKAALRRHWKTGDRHRALDPSMRFLPSVAFRRGKQRNKWGCLRVGTQHIFPLSLKLACSTESSTAVITNPTLQTGSSDPEKESKHLIPRSERQSWIANTSLCSSGSDYRHEENTQGTT